MADKIIALPKTAAEHAATFTTEQLAPMSPTDGGLPKPAGPTEDQIKASGWFASEDEGTKKEVKTTTPEKKSTEVKTGEQQLEGAEKEATEGELTDDTTDTGKEIAKTDEEIQSELPAFLKAPTEQASGGEEGKQADKSGGKLAGSKAFDYTGFSADETRHLKNMDKNAREFTAGLIKKSKEVVTQETSYLQHPNGYMLAPEYQAAQAGYNSAYQQYNHWKQQVLNCRAGKPVQDIAIDDKTGQMSIVGEIKSNDEVEEKCREMMMLAQQKAETERGVITSFPQRFKQTLAKDTMGISKTLEAKCPWVAKPELLKYRMDVKFEDGQTRNVSLGELKQGFLNQFPPYMRSGNIGIEVAANAWIGMLIHEKSAEAASSGRKAAEIKTAEQRRAEPSGGGKKQEIKTVGGVKEFNSANAGIEFGV